ncbi:hypothetical protein SMBr_30710 [Shewanella sp. M-Br]|nr:hypothetical protein SMBr_30710 [Shewanella sp. M-Br]
MMAKIDFNKKDSNNTFVARILPENVKLTIASNCYKVCVDFDEAKHDWIIGFKKIGEQC